MKRQKTTPPSAPDKNRKNKPGLEKNAHPDSFPVVGIGASAGGLEAFEEFFAGIPQDIGMAFILIPHLDPDHASMMSQLLRRSTKMEVKEAEEGMKVAPNTVYVIPPNKEMSIFNGTLSLEPLKKIQGAKLPIDSFFRSLAEDQGERAIGIVLSGTGADGTLGLRAIHGAGGTVMVQTPGTAKYPGMPSSAVEAGLADVVAPVDKLPQHLLNYVRRSGSRAKSPMTREDRLRKILALVRQHTGRDFSLYKKTTLNRRVEKRMNLLNLAGTKAYIGYLQEHPEEIQMLFKDMLIGVTQFFRDQEAFDVLKGMILKYIRDNPDLNSFRAWVPGCGTGEEAFSITMIIMECIQELSREVKLQIFGTDIDEESINRARAGVYSDNIAADVSPARLKRFFVKDERGFRVKKDVRESIVFAVQDVTKDPPFTKLDLLSCRNLLIYLEPELQDRLLPLFHYSLKPGGILLLGNSESMGKYGALFSVADKKWKLFYTTRAPHAVHEEDFKGLPWVENRRPPEAEPEGFRKPREVDVSSLAEKALLGAFAPPSVVANEKGEILYIHGETGRYLEPAPGRPNWNVFEMARKGVQFEVRSGVNYALTRMKERRFQKLEIKVNGARHVLDLTVKPFAASKDSKLVIISFEDVIEKEKRKAERAKAKSPERDSRLKELESELNYTRETLQSTVEELQAANEELKSTNEEMQSSNEELQSTNEELETSREELQSMNEELTTVNSELQGKIDELSQAESDMKILLESTQIGIIFLDKDLRIERFTSRATNLFNLIPGDVGRPLHDIRSHLKDDDVEPIARETLQTLQTAEREVRTKDGKSYLIQVVPYRTGEDVIKGVVLNFTDITEVRRTRSLSRIFDTVREPLLVLDRDYRVLLANRSFYRTFSVVKEETEGSLLHELGNGQWDIPELKRLLGEILKENKEFNDFLVEHKMPRVGPKRILLNARKILLDGEAKGDAILLALEDITDNKYRECEPGAKPIS